MALDFGLDDIVVTEFGVGIEDAHGTNFVAVPADNNVQAALCDMARATWSAMQGVVEGPAQYEPGEKHGSTEYLRVNPSDGFDQAVRALHETERLTIDGNALDPPDSVMSYFARFTDNLRRHLTGVRRASQFKGILKPPKIHFRSDTLRLVEDDIFRLDTDFDLLIDSELTHIWRPSGFELLGKLKDKILNSVSSNIDSIRQDLPYVDLQNVEHYASTHARAARYLASIRTHNLRGIDRAALETLCRRIDVQMEVHNNQIVVSDASIMGFLEVLDRRRYRVDLVPQSPEQFRAASRSRIDQ